jgi:hypothetical protein
MEAERSSEKLVSYHITAATSIPSPIFSFFLPLLFHFLILSVFTVLRRSTISHFCFACRFAINGGHVTYQSRFLQTQTYKRNIAAQRIVVTEFGTKAVPDPCQTIFQRYTAPS